MKLKILYYAGFSVCLIQSIFWLFFPFGGINSVIHVIRKGLLESGNQTEMNLVPHSNFHAIFFKPINSGLALLYFAAIFLGCLLPLWYNMKTTLKYKIGLGLGMLSVFILVAVKLINTYLIR